MDRLILCCVAILVRSGIETILTSVSVVRKASPLQCGYSPVSPGPDCSCPFRKATGTAKTATDTRPSAMPTAASVGVAPPRYLCRRRAHVMSL